MQQEFPTLQEAGKVQKQKEPFRQASDDASKAFREFKRLGEKKHSIETRAAKLQKELERCSEELAETTHLLDKAQVEHHKHIRTFAEVVQPTIIEADISDEDLPAEGCEEDFTGDEKELDENGRKRQKVQRKAWNRATRETSGTQQQQQQQQQEDSMRDTQREPQTDSEWLQDQETEEFQGFKNLLTDDQRILMERQMQLAVQRARDAATASSTASSQQQKEQQQQTKQEGLGAKDLMAASKLLGAFAEALQTKPAPEHG